MKRGLVIALAIEGTFLLAIATAGKARAKGAVKRGIDAMLALPIEPLAKLEPQTTCDPGAKPGTLAFRQAIIERFGQAEGAIENIERGCGIGGPSEHKEGRAWDWFPPSKAIGDDAIAMLLAPSRDGEPFELARRAGIMYMIWHGMIWRAYQGGTWGRYTGPNPHTDHVHFSFSREGANGETSFYVFPVI